MVAAVKEWIEENTEHILEQDLPGLEIQETEFSRGWE